MCEIQFIMGLGKDRLSKYDVNQMAKLLETGSKTNDDGFGVFSEKINYKEEGKFDTGHAPVLKNLFKDSRFLIGHNRLATTGKTKARNSHPFENERFVWVHNGIISNFDTLKSKHNANSLLVDSEIIGYLIYKKVLEATEVIKAIELALAEIEGSVSAFIYDKETGKLYYVKTLGLSFSFEMLSGEGRNLLTGSTGFENLGKAYKKEDKGKKLYENKGVLYPENDIIYEVRDTGVWKVGKFKCKETQFVSIYKDNKKKGRKKKWNTQDPADYDGDIYGKYHPERDDYYNREYDEIDIARIERDFKQLCGGIVYLHRKDGGRYEIRTIDVNTRRKLEDSLGVDTLKETFLFSEIVKLVGYLETIAIGGTL